MNVNEVRKAGELAGAKAEESLALFGQGITAAIIPTIKALPQGKALKLITEFWVAFAKGGPTAAKVRRVAVTRSESLRIAAGIDAGVPFVGTWQEAVKAAPKRSTKGRKARPTDGTADKAPVVPAVPKGSNPGATFRQLVSTLVAFHAKHGAELPEAYGKAVTVFDAAIRKVPTE